MEMTINSVDGSMKWENVGDEIQSKFLKYIDNFQQNNNNMNVPLTFKEWLREYLKDNN